jgi:hypothetical protein
MFSIRIILHPIKVLFLLAFSINPNNLFFPGKTTTNYRFSDCSASISPRSSEGTFEMQSSSTMGIAEFNMLDNDTVCMDNSILAMPPRRSSKNFLEDYEVVLILDDRENFGFV